MVTADAYRELGEAAWRWVRSQLREEDGPWLPESIAAFLFRLARVMDDGREAPVVDRPDEWWAVPARLRTAHR